MGGVGPLLLCGILGGVLSGILWAPPVSAAPAGVTVAATVDGRRVSDERLVLDPAGSVKITATVHNGSDEVRHVKAIRLSGTALGLTLFSFDTAVPFDVPARESATRSFALDLGGLGGQATGLLPTAIEVVDADRRVIASVATTGDVRGSLWSVYGVFGGAVAVLAVVAWAGALWASARRRLPARRWRRAAHFLPAGVGTGLAAVVVLSVLRVVAPTPAAGAGFVLGAAGVAFLLGWLTPPPVVAPPVDPEATQRIPRPVPGRT